MSKTIRELETALDHSHTDTRKWSSDERAAYREWLEAEHLKDTRYISLAEAWDRA